MGSGKYSALSGAVAREQAMANIAANLANVTTTGFKRDRTSFAAVLKDARQIEAGRGINHTRIQRIAADFSQGALQETGRPLDLAIEGEGFFKVRRGGEVFYTRAGHLQIDENGLVRTADGLNLVDATNQPLQLDTTTARDIVIAESGEISVDGEVTDSRIQVVAFTDPKLLVKAGNTLYRAGEGAAERPAENTRVLQGSLETANVNMMEEMTAMVRTQRAFEVHHKAIESYSKLGEKLEASRAEIARQLHADADGRFDRIEQQLGEMAEGVRQVRGTSVNQVEDLDRIVVTAGTGVPTSGLVLTGS